MDIKVDQSTGHEWDEWDESAGESFIFYRGLRSYCGMMA